MTIISQKYKGSSESVPFVQTWNRTECVWVGWGWGGGLGAASSHQPLGSVLSPKCFLDFFHSLPPTPILLGLHFTGKDKISLLKISQLIKGNHGTVSCSVAVQIKCGKGDSL